MALGAEAITRGRYDLYLPDRGEDDLAVLGFQFNQMASRLKATLADLVKDREAMKDVISDISHQLKTPLSSLRTFNELLMSGACEDAEIRKDFLRESETQLERMEWLISSMLKASRMEAGTITPEFRAADIVGTIGRAVALLGAYASEKGQTIEAVGLDKPLVFRHDPNWLGEAVRNLVKNAITYSPPSGRIRICLEQNGSRAITTVTDWGSGIVEQDMSHIFKRFYRGQAGRASHRDGTGIGLYLSRLIVDKLGEHLPQVCQWQSYVL